MYRKLAILEIEKSLLNEKLREQGIQTCGTRLIPNTVHVSKAPFPCIPSLEKNYYEMN